MGLADLIGKVAPSSKAAKESAEDRKPDHGKAVENGFIRYLSVSALQSADPETYGGCPRRWFFKYVLGNKEPETSAQGEGKRVHKELEHYLKTGEDILGPVARAGKHLLPKPGPDIRVEEDFGKWKAAIALREQGGAVEEVKALAKLTANGIPLVGYIDFRHMRGEYVDEEGCLKKEVHPRTMEVGDHKTSSRIRDTSEGKAYVKTKEELVDSIQMVGYTVAIADQADVARLSHLNYLTRGGRDARKVTALLPVEDALRKWERIDGLASMLEDIAKETDAAKVEAQPESCNSYKYGCPHRKYCDGGNQPIVNLLGKVKKGSTTMNLFGKIQKTEGAAPAAPQSAPVTQPTAQQAKPNIFARANLPASQPTPPAEDEQRRAAIEAEKAKLLASASATAPASTAPASTAPTKQPCGSPGCGVGCAAGWKKSPSGLTNAFVECEVCGATAKRAAAASAVNPPDAKPSNPTTAAEKLPLEEVAKIENEELRQKAVAQHATGTGTTPEVEEKTSGRCPGGKIRYELTLEQVKLREMACPRCKKEIAIRPAEENGKWFATLSGHNIPKKDEAASAPVVEEKSTSTAPASAPVTSTAPASAPVTTATLAPASVVSSTPVVEEKAATGITVFVDIAFERGPQPKHLDEYVHNLAAMIANEYGVLDIRFVSDKNNALAFGNWRGALAVLAQSRPPEPGEYQARSSDEMVQVVVNALAPSCARVLRGMGR